MIDKLINKTELRKALRVGKNSLNSDNTPIKYKATVQELNDLINYWKQRYNLG